ncbi:hypothetical protein WJX73_001897 [Symbiochloris irregularis]|uniref:Uncharacterized protein n=1 Tax=Symbiochloris irregularis TaxID=706552 RepID=A0AAW1P285_9CHLO
MSDSQFLCRGFALQVRAAPVCSLQKFAPCQPVVSRSGAASRSFGFRTPAAQPVTLKPAALPLQSHILADLVPRAKRRMMEEMTKREFMAMERMGG